MSQHYSDLSRENDTYALPDVEVFYLSQSEIEDLAQDYAYDKRRARHAAGPEEGWYFWPCFPGCMPDSDPMGPYDSEQAAIDASREE